MEYSVAIENTDMRVRAPHTESGPALSVCMPEPT